MSDHFSESRYYQVYRSNRLVVSTLAPLVISGGVGIGIDIQPLCVWPARSECQRGPLSKTLVIMLSSIVGRLKLVEENRASWTNASSGPPWLKDYRFMIPSSPGQIVMCGLILCWLMLAARSKQSVEKHTRFCNTHSETRGNLTRLDQEVFRSYQEHLQYWRYRRPRKIVATSLEYRTLSQQSGVFDKQLMNFKMLATMRSKLNSQWLGRTVEYGE